MLSALRWLAREERGYERLMNDAGSNEAHVPPVGHDSTVEDWFGQSAARDAELADELTEEVGEERAEELFNQQAEGAAEQEARHGDRIDPDQGRTAYAKE
jgi:hypothetical protein